MSSSPEALPPVSRTAVGVAGLRAVESGRPDRLFEDPYAGAFFQAGQALFPAEARGGGLGRVFAEQVAIRTRFFDEFLEGADQVVLLAAGLDARAFRLDWPEGARVFELDLPEVLEFKDAVLAARSARPRCERVVVPVDLREDWPTALRESGFAPERPTAWLAEGLLVYLDHDEAARLLTDVTALSAPGSRISFEHRSEDDELLRRARAVPNSADVTGLWKGGLGRTAPEWLTEHGWRPETHSRTELAAGYGRPSEETTSGGFLVGTR
ncbi:SAM-dependent methyltransferase [Amycolatopsis sp. PS_44_ISF1]|uniref:SAM-dependent methyltransferase n=1 Tax=Amycolatopsis sp. PS_44_ISF1 TaxID=2974917 RepID=UPI0028DE53B4|nr:SAM-dependent methyltransferase [Amycolatopsis sp. PS_44_ISF1]MDT8910774.1 SAM-dependent methyltransferase [Amycolatopsis sp. PS_44_ISF1]